MKNSERTGVDIHVAMSRFTGTLASARSGADTDEPASPPEQLAAARPAPAPLSFKSRIKRKARPFAAWIYRLAKPVLRPLAFRIRAYLTEPLRTELLHSQASIQASAKAAAEAAAAEVNATLHRVEAKLERMLAARTLETIQEIQAARESLRSRIDATSDARESIARRLDAVEGANRAWSANLPPRLDRIEQYAAAAARRVAVPCGPDELLVRTIVGYVLCAASDQALLSSLIESGELEPGTRILIQRMLEPGSTFVDVGANIGMHTLAAAHAMAGSGRIIAFEPFAPTHALLRKTIWMNGFSAIVETHQSAASNHSGTQTLFLGATSGHHSLYELQPSNLQDSPSTVDVALVRIDDVIPAGVTVDLMKIDVEGAELQALEGASRTITNNRDIALIVEFGGSHIQRSGHTPDDWLGAFERFGLEFGVIDSESGKLETWPRQRLDSTESVNLFFARRDSETWRSAWESQ